VKFGLPMNSSSGSPTLSVVICTFNRAQLLEGCLTSLTDQIDDGVEVIVVDNNSHDNTPEIVAKFSRADARIKYCKEPKQGLAAARNRGYQSSSGHYVAYIDDDARASSDWCARILAFALRNPHVQAFGGPYRPFFLQPPPSWFKHEYGGWALGDEERPLRSGEYINGTNMVYSRDLLKDLEGFSTALGMRGSILAYGEETHLQRRLAALGHVVYYVPDMVVEHLVAPAKMSVRWMVRSMYMTARDADLVFGSCPSVPRSFASLAKQLMLFPVRVIFSSEAYFKNRMIEALRPIAWATGLFVRALRGSDRR
jgi:glycosyltransferase involved in cell wall biosynthesis